MPKEKKTKKAERIKPDLPGGFRDYGPADAIAKQAMTDTIRRTFESFGYDPLQTSSVQRTEVLTGGDEDSGKIIFNIKGSQEKKSDSSLRFDLTVPLARFVAANPDLPRPFKRYQIGSVWRGERQQQGRYREFMQADFDIVGTSSIDADAEIVIVLYEALKKIGVENFKINYNNRKLLDAMPQYAGFPQQKLWEVLRIIDKIGKIGKPKMMDELKKIVQKKAILERIDNFIFGSGGGDEKYDDLRAIRKILEAYGIDPDILTPLRFMVRGFSYYTGSVFEVILPDAPEVGSIAGGGRYDDLIFGFTGQKIPSVGASIGIDRLFAAMEKLGMRKRKQTLTKVLILQLDQNLKADYLRMADELRNAGINTALYLGDDQSFQAQLAYAVKKEIPYVVICGEKEKAKGVVAIKNLGTREQREVPREKIAEFFKPS